MLDLGTMEIAVGQGLRSEVPEIVDLLAVQLQEHGISLSKCDISAAVLGIFEDRTRGAVLAAREGVQLVGVACVAFIWTIEHGGKSAWLEELYVLPEWRSQGIGQKLMDAVVELARNTKCRALDLDVDFSHRRVESLYRRNGFLQHSRARWYRPL